MLADDRIEKVTKPAVAKYVLVGWKNIQDEEGNDIPYSVEQSLEFLRDPQLADLYEFVMVVAGNAGNFRAEMMEESAGN